jgi:hypothetical protein
MRTQPVKRAVLPVTALRAGPTQVDIARQPQADETIQELFPLALLQPDHSGTTRVVIERAGASLGASTSARLALVDAGFGVIERRAAGNAEVDSMVYVAGGSDQAMARGREVATRLGLPESAIIADVGRHAVVDIKVVLGSTFRPL